MAKLQKVTLGTAKFDVKQPKLGELRAIVDALDGLSGASGGGMIDAAVAVLVAGLRPTHPDITAEAVLDIECTATELNDAVAVVLRTAGLRETEATGEAAPQLAA